jgi:hypothetical protein
VVVSSSPAIVACSPPGTSSVDVPPTDRVVAGAMVTSVPPSVSAASAGYFASSQQPIRQLRGRLVAFVVLIGRVTTESSLDRFAALLSVEEIVPVSSLGSSITILSETAMIALARSE